MAGGMYGEEGTHGWGMHGRGACMAGGVGMHGRGRAWQGACMAGGYMHGRGVHGRGHEWRGRQPLQRTVRILLECILVFKIFIPLRKE